MRSSIAPWASLHAIEDRLSTRHQPPNDAELIVYKRHNYRKWGRATRATLLIDGSGYNWSPNERATTFPCCAVVCCRRHFSVGMLTCAAYTNGCCRCAQLLDELQFDRKPNNRRRQMG